MITDRSACALERMYASFAWSLYQILWRLVIRILIKNKVGLYELMTVYLYLLTRNSMVILYQHWGSIQGNLVLIDWGLYFGENDRYPGANYLQSLDYSRMKNNMCGSITFYNISTNCKLGGVVPTYLAI